MDKLIISGEGFPGTNEFLQFMDNAHGNPIAGMARAFGSNVIVSGMYSLVEVNGTPVPSDGWLVYNGELLPFVGGQPQAEKVAIIEEITESGYDTNGTGDFTNVQPVWKKRYCTFGTLATPGAVAEFSWTSLTRIDSVETLGNRLRILRKGSMFVDNIALYGEEFTTVTGNFTNVETSVPPSYDYTIVTISFSEIEGEYIPIIVPNNQSVEILNQPVNVLEKTSTSLTLVLQRNVVVGNWYELVTQELLIYLIG